MRNFRLIFLISLVFFATVISTQAQEKTMGALFGNPEGYTLFRSQLLNQVYLIDGQGRSIHEWTVSRPGHDAILRENGNLVVTVSQHNPDPENFASVLPWIQLSGRFEEYTWDGELVWAYEFNRPNYRIHHGIRVLPNGNILFIAWERKTNEEAIAAGRDPEKLGDGLWTDVFLEYSPQSDQIVWEWHVWDHLIQDFDPDQANYGVVEDHPERIDINFYEEPELIEDWIHSNAVDYNPALNQLAISAREFNEVWVIDHNTTTEEAAGEAGDLLYRWGNPRAYGRGDADTRQIFYQHDVHWIPEGNPGEGNIILYSNRHTVDNDDVVEDDDVMYSSVIEFTPPLQPDGTYALETDAAYGPAQPTWLYNGLPDHLFFSNFVSGVQRLPDGNTLIIQGGSARLFEVTPDGNLVWEYIAPFNELGPVAEGMERNASIFRARRYQSDYPGLQGRDLTPGMLIEEMATQSP